MLCFSCDTQPYSFYSFLILGTVPIPSTLSAAALSMPFSLSSKIEKIPWMSWEPNWSVWHSTNWSWIQFCIVMCFTSNCHSGMVKNSFMVKKWPATLNKCPTTRHSFWALLVWQHWQQIQLVCVCVWDWVVKEWHPQQLSVQHLMKNRTVYAIHIANSDHTGSQLASQAGRDDLPLYLFKAVGHHGPEPVLHGRFELQARNRRRDSERGTSPWLARPGSHLDCWPPWPPARVMYALWGKCMPCERRPRIYPRKALHSPSKSAMSIL